MRRFASAVGALQPNGVTLVVLMGVGRSAAIATTLVEHGWSPATPAAIVANASAADQQVWRGTLAQLAERGEADSARFRRFRYDSSSATSSRHWHRP